MLLLYSLFLDAPVLYCGCLCCSCACCGNI